MTEQHNSVHSLLIEKGFLSVNKNAYSLIKTFDDNNTLQEKCAAIITAWATANDGLYKVINSYLCNVYFYDELPVYFVIHKPHKNPECTLQEVIDILYDLALSSGLPFLQVRYIEDKVVKEYNEVKGYDVATEYRSIDFEYVYAISSLSNLEGPDNYYKRKRVNKFKKMQDINIRPMTKENINVCIDIEEEWCKDQYCDVCGAFCGCERDALKIMIDIFNEDIHKGALLYKGESPVGYIITEKIDGKVVFLYFGKAIIPDGFVYLIYMFFKDCDAEYMSMNDEMGNAGLRQFKQQLSEYELWRRNIFTFVKNGEKK